MFAALITLVVLFNAFIVFAFYAYREGKLKSTRGWSNEDRKVLMYLVQQLMVLKGYNVIKRRHLPLMAYLDKPVLVGTAGSYAGGYDSGNQSVIIGALESGIVTLGHELAHWCQPGINEAGYVPAYTLEQDEAKAKELYKADQHEIEAHSIGNMLMLATAFRFSLFKLMRLTKEGRAAIKAWEAMPWDESRSRGKVVSTNYNM
jgi:hypothetical protein